MPAKKSEQSAITTVPPANATALPELAVDRATASGGSTPAASSSR